MANKPNFDFKQGHKRFGLRINNETWQLIDKKNRTPEEDEQMIYAAYASCYHWRKVGTHVHDQRGEWMIARAYTLTFNKTENIFYANRCLAIAQAHPDEMKDFDWAFIYEGIARANALAGNTEVATQFIKKAKTAARAIVDPEDLSVFQSEFQGYQWHGVSI